MTENKRFTIEREVDICTGRQCAIHLIDTIGNLPRLIFTDPTDLYEWEKAFTEEWTALKDENKQLKQRLKEKDQLLQKTLTANDNLQKRIKELEND